MLKNDKNHTPEDPYEYFAGPGDVQSWARLFTQLRDKVIDLAESNTKTQLVPLENEAAAWATRTGKYAGLVGVGGVEPAILADGFAWDTTNDELIDQLILESEEAQRLIRVLRNVMGVPGGDDVGTTDDGKALPVSNEIKLVALGGLLAGAGWLAYKRFG